MGSMSCLPSRKKFSMQLTILMDISYKYDKLLVVNGIFARLAKAARLDDTSKITKPPDMRTTPSYPFSAMSVDYLGPMEVRDSVKESTARNGTQCSGDMPPVAPNTETPARLLSRLSRSH